MLLSLVSYGLAKYCRHIGERGILYSIGGMQDPGSGPVATACTALGRTIFLVTYNVYI